MKKILLLIIFFQIFPYLISIILLLHGNMDTYKFYNKIIDNFDNIKFVDTKIKSKGDYIHFMAKNFDFEESRNMSRGMAIGFNLYANFGIIFLLCLLYCLLYYKCIKGFIAFILYFLCFLGLCLCNFLGRELKNYIKLYKGRLIFEDANLNKEFLALIHYHSLPKILGILIEYSSFVNILLFVLFLFKYKN